MMTWVLFINVSYAAVVIPGYATEAKCEAARAAAQAKIFLWERAVCIPGPERVQ